MNFLKVFFLIILVLVGAHTVTSSSLGAEIGPAPSGVYCPGLERVVDQPTPACGFSDGGPNYGHFRCYHTVVGGVCQERCSLISCISHP
jgi:hypothetical protein